MWESVQIDGDEFRPSGDHVLGTWTLHAHGRDGMEVTSTVTWVLTVNDGRLTRATMYQERAEALAAAGFAGEE
jgi:ketosteroid isomerase-like protein